MCEMFPEAAFAAGNLYVKAFVKCIKVIVWHVDDIRCVSEYPSTFVVVFFCARVSPYPKTPENCKERDVSELICWGSVR